MDMHRTFHFAHLHGRETWRWTKVQMGRLEADMHGTARNPPPPDCPNHVEMRYGTVRYGRRNGA
eukprot:351795-Chlamydomonas_euryale.AAC.3